MNYLIVIAHPDDEVLGAGGLIYQAAKEGHTVSVCALSGMVRARYLRPSDEELDDDIQTASGILGIAHVTRGDFPNIALNSVPHLDLVRFVENAILQYEPDIMITHHMADINNDHLHTFLACQEALRLFQRREGIKPIRELLLMEVFSNTEWNNNPALRPFVPDTFVEIGREGLEKKLEALAAYRGVMHAYPHPRSREALEGLAAMRGAQAGLCYAEAFETAFRRGL